MAQHQFSCLIIIAALSTQSCWSDSLQRTTPRTPDMTLPSLLKEVEDNSRYKTLEANATILNLLVNDKGGVSRSEVFDMLHSRDDREDHIDLPIFPEDIEDEKASVPLTPDSQAEYLQGAESVVNRDSVRSRYRGEAPGAAAGIMVLVTCSIVCLAYTALIVWRRIYLKRNGLKHELLRNEETMAETRIEL